MKKTLLALLMITISATATASNRHQALYEVTITNLTKGQTFTPRLVVTHSSAVRLFTVGEPASEELAVLAEDGGTGPLTNVLENAGSAVADVVTDGGLLGPGMTTGPITVAASRRQRLISVAAMLIPTNDTFFALNSQRLPLFGERTIVVPAYDAGSEANDQNCNNMPGPRCGGQGSSPGANAGDEGFVHISNGFHDLGEVGADGGEILGPFTYDWRNPAAQIRIKRIR